MLVLQVLQGADRGRKFELPDHEPQLIGRSSEALPISDTTVSRRHAELTPDDGRWYIRDLDSANGTFVNGQSITDRVQLTPGDQIRCGSMLFVFTISKPDRRRTPIRILDADTMDVTVQSTTAGTDGDGATAIRTAIDPVRTASDHLRVIYDLTALTASTFDREALLGRVMDLIFEEFRPDRGFVLLGDDSSRPLDALVVRYRERPRTADEGRIPVSRTIIQHVMDHAAGVLSTNAMSDTRFRSGDSVRDYGIRSAICVPITAGSRLFGVIHIDSQLADFTFTAAQLQLMNAIGQHTGLALRTAELVEAAVRTERLAAIGQTVASLSHSIKNILQGLRGGADAVELALNKGDLGLAREGWPILSRNLDRIYTLTLNMLAFSRQSGPDLELADLNAVVREVAELMMPACDHKPVGLILDLGEDIPPVPVDVNGLHQALVNLVINAVDAVPPRKGVVTITSSYDAAAPTAVITVSDNGSGIPEPVRPRVFEAFRSTKGQRGTGLGLAVTRKIVEEHGGTIHLECPSGGGTTVRLQLPADRGAIDAGETRLPRPLPDDHLKNDF